MVFRGRPSKGCGECRRKKIRCDQQRPSCSQCLRSKDHRPCPGYRDEQSLQFFDESSQVAQKAQAKQALKEKRRQMGSQSSESSSNSVVSSGASSPDPGSWTLFNNDPSSVIAGEFSSFTLLPALEDQGIKFFMANYVMADSDRCAGHLQDLLSWKTTQSNTLQVAMKAVGLAGLSNQRQDPTLMAKARDSYVTALRLTQGHLKNPQEAKEDRTLTSVALLALFEILTSNSPLSVLTWMHHVNGSIALLNLRGEELLKSEFGYAVFLQARIQILISCFQRESHVPPVVLRLGSQISAVTSKTSRIANAILLCVTDLCELRASIKEGTLTSPTEIISLMLELYDRVLAWSSERSTYWDHTTIFVTPKDPNFSDDEIYDGSFSVYNAPWIAGTWNISRSTRIFVHEAILAQIDILLTQSQSPSVAIDLLCQRSKSLAIIQDTAADVCASIPYLLNHHRSRAEQAANPPRAAAGYFVLTSLYLAGSTIGVPQSMRLYAISRLRFIGHRLGLGQALMLAEILAAKIDETARKGLEVGSHEIQGVPRQIAFKDGPEDDEVQFDSLTDDSATREVDRGSQDGNENYVAGIPYGFDIAVKDMDFLGLRSR